MNATKYAAKNLQTYLKLNLEPAITHTELVYNKGISSEETEGDLYIFIKKQLEKAHTKKLVDPIVKVWERYCYIFHHAPNGPVLIAIIELPQSCIAQSETLTSQKC